MKREVQAMVVVVLGLLAFGAGGCAKHEMVKAEEPLAPSATTTTKKTQAPPQVQPAAPAPAPIKVEPAPVKAETLPSAAEAGVQGGELKSSLDKIYFNFDSASLSQEARDRLVKNAEYLKRAPGTKIRIEGNCDERGSDEYNLALGEKRATAAKKYLTDLGVSADRLSVISYGKEKPVDPGHDEAAWAKNRRDEFVVPEK